ncbi:MAG TPA: hypothetical protein VFA66_05265 [Gaiellaceae bacterium]|nr:hypothetical protein [Gaiellaceae bacterium]
MRVLVAAAAALLAASATPASGGASGCGVAAARRAIASTHLRMKLLGPTRSGSIRRAPTS